MISGILSANTDIKSIERNLNIILEEKITQELQRVSSDSFMIVKVESDLSNSKVQKWLRRGEVSSVRFPLGSSAIISSTLTVNDTNAEIGDLSKEYNELVNGVKVSLEWDVKLSPEQVQSLEKKVKNHLKLNDEASFSFAYNNLPKIGVQPSVREESFLAEYGLAAGVILSLFFLVNFATKFFQYKSMSGFGNKLVESLSSVMSRNASDKNSHITLKNNVETFAPRTETGSSFWEDASIAELVNFSYDCLSHPSFESCAAVLAHGILSPQKSKDFQEALSPFFFDRDGAAKNLVSRSELEHLFLKNKMEYALLSNKPLAKTLLPLSISACIDLVSVCFKEHNYLNALIILNRISPLKNEMVIGHISLEEKIALSEAAVTMVNTKELHALEHKINKQIESRELLHLGSYSENNFKNLFAQMISPKSFAEDELFFQANISSYISPLKGLSKSYEEFWSKFSLTEVAQAYYGYSDEKRKLLLAKFPKDKVQWINDSIAKAKKSGLSWSDNEVVSARISILKYLEVDQKNNEAHNNQDETNILDLPRAA
jgi:hypothetical protein